MSAGSVTDHVRPRLYSSGQSAPAAWLLRCRADARLTTCRTHAIKSRAQGSAPAPSARTGSGGRIPWRVSSRPRRALRAPPRCLLADDRIHARRRDRAIHIPASPLLRRAGDYAGRIVRSRQRERQASSVRVRGTSAANATRMKASRLTTPMAWAHGASARLSSPMPTISSATASRAPSVGPRSSWPTPL